MAKASETLNRILAIENAVLSLVESGRETDRRLQRLSDEFKEEMRELKEEMREFKDDTQDFKDEMRAFKDEMRAFKDEMREFKVQAERDRSAMNRRLGEIANAQGRLVEDLIGPTLPAIVRRVLALPPDQIIAPSGIRWRLAHPSEPERIIELDSIAGHDGTIVVCEVKSRLGPETVTDLAARLPSIRDLLTPLGARELIGARACTWILRSWHTPRAWASWCSR